MSMFDTNLAWYALGLILLIPIVLGALGRIFYEFLRFAFSPTVAFMFIVALIILLDYWGLINLNPS